MILINLDDTLRWRYGFFSDLLVWCIGLRKVRIFDDPLVQYVHICALKKRQCIGLRRILYINENELTCYPLQYNMSASVYPMRSQMGSHIVQSYVTTPYYSTYGMLIHVQHREQSIQSIFNPTSIYDEVVWYFPKVPCVQAHFLNIL